MVKKTRTVLMFFLCAFCLSGALLDVRVAHAAEDKPFKSTPYPVPRFVSLGSEEVFVRTGPGKRYPIDWVFEQEGLPVEIILEFEHWRKIRDVDGQKGWVYGPLLSGKRTALVAHANQEQGAYLLNDPREGSEAIARIEHNVLVRLKSCQEKYCRIEAGDMKGWVVKTNLWGVYSDEVFE